MNGKKRIRLSPEGRRNQLLDSARDLIQDQGFSGFTMEALATEAGVSNPLVYKYFDTRLELLQELWTREYERYNRNVREQLTKAENFEDIVRLFVNLNFTELSLGEITHILGSQPELREVTKAKQKSNQRGTGLFLVNTVEEMYHLTPSQATHLVVLASGASIEAARHYARYGGSRKKMVEDTVNFILNGAEAFRT
ncbi:MAG: TetR/AcrR family transcriptional regulator [Pseudomonadales bacterium]|jgi:AcrR family transcriptional regulator|nr:TetR/AcrR family transcriptional regulator [Pseudomonadales bacterium]MDG1305698.1 TetR/AcrR family transcriptional regulator [Pseudomonadales bacterium]MDG1835334.1 TetR/AcrR family transcriptional regulator [Pseudomonadales bacterium]MDG1907707.1 TetR/AcrR family transcriptional regulator [Pseudomonadales bacterium]|tara:strand:+ start:310 stop:897 length:588 start_codon:yes stop_codon:yes gene_type:complete